MFPLLSLLISASSLLHHSSISADAIYARLSPSETAQVVFANPTHCPEGTPVMFAGDVIGRVSKTSPDNENAVLQLTDKPLQAVVAISVEYTVSRNETPRLVLELVKADKSVSSANGAIPGYSSLKDWWKS